MNRRKAIAGFLLIGGAGVASYAGIKLFDIYKIPDLKDLENSSVIINQLAGLIIPRTDSPGAEEIRAGEVIIKLIKECLDKKSQNKFISGLSRIQTDAKNKYGKPFHECSHQERVVLLKDAEQQGKPFKGLAGKVERKLLGDSFFVTLKKFTVMAYCTSREGATQALAYDVVPGKYINTKLRQGQKAWATQ